MKNKIYRQILICCIISMLAFAYGISVGVYHIPPFQVLFTIKEKIDTDYGLVKSPKNFSFFDPEAELELTLDYLSEIEVPDTSEDVILEGLGMSYEEKNVFITEKMLVNSYIFENIRVELYKVKTNIGFEFSFLEFVSTNSTNVRGTLIFLHGHTCDPEELIGLKKSRYADPIMFDLLENDIRVIYPYKYDTYEEDNSHIIQIKTALAGKTLEALEQYKIAALMNEYGEEKKILFGFSHGAWQALIASVINECDFIIPLTQISPGYPSFYTDYDVAVKSIYNYPELFRLSKSDRIVILAGEYSQYTYKEYLNSIFENSPEKKVDIVYYRGGHYISSDTVNEFINKEIEKITQVK